MPAALGNPVWLVRHAPTAWTGRRWCGRADPPLSRRGSTIATALGRRLADEVPPGAVVWTSPARRALSTATAIASAIGASPTVVPDLVEVDVGLAEGLAWAELSATFPDLAAALVAGDVVDWPAGEAHAAVAIRAGEVADLLLEASASHPLVVVSHGGLLHAVATDLVARGAIDATAGDSRAGLEPAGVLRLAPGSTSRRVA